MIIKRKNKNEIIKLTTIFLVVVGSIIVFIKTDIKVLSFIVGLYFLSLLINGIKMLSCSKIILDKNILKVNYLSQTNKNDFVSKLFSPFIIKWKHYILKSYSLNINDIKKIGFVKDLEMNFKGSTKFDIGIISKDKEKYLIPMKQYEEIDILNLIKELNKSVSLIGDLKNITK